MRGWSTCARRYPERSTRRLRRQLSSALAVVGAAEDLVAEGLARPTLPTTFCSPSTTIGPATVRALWVARAPHQQTVSTCSISMRSASSIRRWEPGKSLVRKSVVMPKANTSAEFIDDEGELLDLFGVEELRLVADHVVDLRVLGHAVLTYA